MRRGAVCFALALGLATSVAHASHRKIATARSLCGSGSERCVDSVESALPKATPEERYELNLLGFQAALSEQRSSLARGFADSLIELDIDQAWVDGVVTSRPRLLELEGRHGDARQEYTSLLDSKRVDTAFRVEALTFLAEDLLSLGQSIPSLERIASLLALIGRLDTEQMELLHRVLQSILDEDLGAYAKSHEGSFSGGATAFEGIRREPNDPQAIQQFRKLYALHPLAANLERLLAETVQLPPRLGVLLPLTGPYSLLGKRLLEAIKLAHTDTLNTENVLDLVVEDTLGTAEGALEAIARLDEEGRVRVAIGPLVSAAAEAAAREAERRSLPLLSLSQSSAVTAAGPHIFRTQLTPTSQAKAVLNYAVDERKLSRFAILYPATRSGAAYAQAFWKQAEERGVAIVAVADYLPDTTDFRDAAGTLTGQSFEKRHIADADLELTHLGKRAPPQFLLDDDGRALPPSLVPGEDIEAVFVPDSYTRSAMAASSMAFLEWSVGGVLAKIPPLTLLGTAGWHDPKLIKLGQKFVRNCVFVDAFNPEDWREPWADFSRRMEGIIHATPTVFEAVAYDTTRVAIAAATIATPTRNAITAQILALHPTSTLTGLQGFDSEGGAIRTLRVFSVQANEIVQRMPYLPPPEPEQP